jgi:hypothetical protein
MNNDITGERAQEKRMYANHDEPLLCASILLGVMMGISEDYS